MLNLGNQRQPSQAPTRLTPAHDETSFLWVAIAMSLANALGSGIVLTIGADLAPADARSEFLGAYRLLVDSGAVDRGIRRFR